jgi:hypothetical protein
MPSCWNKMWDFAENSYEIIENLIVFAFANLDMSETRIFIYMKGTKVLLFTFLKWFKTKRTRSPKSRVFLTVAHTSKMYGILLEASNFRQLSQQVGHTISTCSQHLRVDVSQQNFLLLYKNLLLLYRIRLQALLNPDPIRIWIQIQIRVKYKKLSQSKNFSYKND